MTTLFSTDLPSRGIPYKDTPIEMRNFSVSDLMLLSRAVHLDSFVPMIEALGNTISSPFKVENLTDGDFFYLIAFQRIKAMTSVLTADWICGDVLMKEMEGLERVFTTAELKSIVEAYDSASEEERKDLQDPGELMVQAIPCEEHNSLPIGMTDLEIVYLDEKQVKNLDEELDFPRIHTLADMYKYRDNPDMVEISQAARWVKQGDTLEEKIDHLKSQSDLTLFEKALKANLQIRHGVSRTVSTKCKRCGSEKFHTLNLNASLFFEVRYVRSKHLF